MVKKIVKVSRDGLTRCPACGNHIRVAEVLADTTCPFCDASIRQLDDPVAAEGAVRRVARALMTGRSSVIAASILGAATMGLSGVGCSTDTNGDKKDDVEEVSTETTGENADTESSGTETGAADDVAEPGDIEEDTSPEPESQADYGGPGEEGGGVDTTTDTGGEEPDAGPDVEEERAPPGEGASDYGQPAFDEMEFPEGE